MVLSCTRIVRKLSAIANSFSDSACLTRRR